MTIVRPLAFSLSCASAVALLLAGTSGALAQATTSEPVSAEMPASDLSGGEDNFYVLETAERGSGTFDGVAPGILGAGGRFDRAEPDLVMTLRGGVQVSPAYFGSDDLEVGPNGAVRIDYLRFPNGFEYGSGQTVGYRTGLGLRGAFRYIGERDLSDHDEIEGLDDVDGSLEAGLGIGYEQRNYRLFADMRYGVIGHNAWAGEVGADGIAYPADGLTVTFGPRFAFGDDRWNDTYFGISDDELASSGLDAYDADGGLVSTGVALGARYLWNDRWGVEGQASYERLMNDAADLPITQAGSKDQYTFTVGITRRISLDF